MAASSATASAASDVGQVVNPEMSACSQNNTWLQVSSPNNKYVVPARGVITSWSFGAGSIVPSSMKLKIGRPVGGNDYTIVGESTSQAPVANTLNTYETRISVEQGDIVGFYHVGNNFARCALPQPAPAGYVSMFTNGDIAPGATATFGTPESSQLDISATLEPDCDSDGFGDETQDTDLNACPPAPDTTITKRPKDKTKKKTATFEFTASEPGATFECSLDGGPFAACSSPDTIKVKKGKHHFEVRAKDAGNNVDATPASDDWKVKKKKKKK
jgi:hypothetical protein